MSTRDEGSAKNAAITRLLLFGGFHDQTSVFKMSEELLDISGDLLPRRSGKSRLKQENDFVCTSWRRESAPCRRSHLIELVDTVTSRRDKEEFVPHFAQLDTFRASQAVSCVALASQHYPLDDWQQANVSMSSPTASVMRSNRNRQQWAACVIDNSRSRTATGGT